MIRPPQSLLGRSSSANGKEMVNAIQPCSDGEIVDQPRGADHRGGDQAHLALRLVERLERRGIDQREIIDPREAARRRSDCLRFVEAPRRPACRRGSRRAPLRALAARRQRLLPLVGRQDRRCATTGRGRRPRARSARRRSRPAMPRSATMRRITASCWKSFSPNSATSGRTASSSLATTVATPSKWPGRASPSQRSDTPDDADRGRKAVADRCRSTDGTHSRSQPAASSIAASSLFAARIAAEVLALAELRRIDEDRRGDPVRALLRLGDQRHVPGVERAHRRHQRDRARPARARARANSSLLRTICTLAAPQLIFVTGRRLHMRRGKDQA